jgi:hypothetical protein
MDSSAADGPGARVKTKPGMSCRYTAMAPWLGLVESRVDSQCVTIQVLRAPAVCTGLKSLDRRTTLS